MIEALLLLTLAMPPAPTPILETAFRADDAFVFSGGAPINNVSTFQCEYLSGQPFRPKTEQAALKDSTRGDDFCIPRLLSGHKSVDWQMAGIEPTRQAHQILLVTEGTRFTPSSVVISGAEYSLPRPDPAFAIGSVQHRAIPHANVPLRDTIHAPSAADDSSTQVGTMGRYVPEPAGMLGQAVNDIGPSQREEQVVHALLGANAFFSVGSRLFTQRCLGESTCVERNKLTRDLYTNRPRTGIMVQAASTAIENYLLWRIHDNSDKRPWVRAAIVGVLAFNVWNFANDLRVYKQTGRNR